MMYVSKSVWGVATSTKWRCNQFLDWDNGSDRLGLPEDETSNLRPGGNFNKRPRWKQRPVGQEVCETPCWLLLLAAQNAAFFLLSFPNQKSSVFNMGFLAVLLALNIGRAAAWQTCNFWQSIQEWGIGQIYAWHLLNTRVLQINCHPSIQILYTTIRLYLRIENPWKPPFHPSEKNVPHEMATNWCKYNPFVDKPVPQVLASHQPIFRARPELKETWTDFQGGFCCWLARLVRCQRLENW